MAGIESEGEEVGDEVRDSNPDLPYFPNEGSPTLGKEGCFSLQILN
jgi:hypothetical protein